MAAIDVEIPEFCVPLLIEFSDYVDAVPLMCLSRVWLQHGRRIFSPEIKEQRSLDRMQSEYLSLPASAKTTISIDFSADGKTFASTHGDHSVRIINYDSGDLVKQLVGHPRTPWTVKFHPTDPTIVASGCLGFEVRVWSTATGETLYLTRLDRAIISLSFHPRGDLLAIAAGGSVHLWEYRTGERRREWSHPHPLRCVRFLPCGGRIIIGAANNDLYNADGARQRITFKLLLWNFDGEQLQTHFMGDGGTPPRSLANSAGGGGGGGDGGSLGSTAGAISRPRTVLERALFYNDGGFDLSADGQFLCSCAEIFVPDTDGARRSGLGDDRGASAGGGASSAAAGRGRTDAPSGRQRAASPRDVADPDERGEWIEHLVKVEIDRSDGPGTWSRLCGTVAAKTPLEATGVSASHIGGAAAAAAAASDAAAAASADDAEQRLVPPPLPSAAPHAAAINDIVTSVKLSPTGAFSLLGYSRHSSDDDGAIMPIERPAVMIYRVSDMKRVNTFSGSSDDVNISRFHPDPGAGLLYGTKQGKIARLRVPSAAEAAGAGAGGEY